MILFDGIYVSAIWVSNYKIAGAPVDFFAMMFRLPGESLWNLEYSLRLHRDDLPPETSKDEVRTSSMHSRDPGNEMELMENTHTQFATGLLPYGTKLLRYNLHTDNFAEIMKTVAMIPSILIREGDKKITTRNRLAD